MKQFNNESPIIIGLIGPAGVGKTSIANALAPPGRVTQLRDLEYYQELDFTPSYFDHISLATPLYEMATIKEQTQGVDKENRILWQLHDILNELMERRVPFDDFYDLIYSVYSRPLDPGAKPRSFLQLTGDDCINRNINCFNGYAYRKAYRSFKQKVDEIQAHPEDMPLFFDCYIISDIRYPHEAHYFASRSNCLIIKLDASPEALAERLINRDGHQLTAQQKKHRTETSIELINQEAIDITIDTSDMTLHQQLDAVYTGVFDFLDTMALHFDVNQTVRPTFEQEAVDGKVE